MTTYLGLHEMGEGKSEEAIVSSWSKYKAACDKVGCSAVHVHYNVAEGKAYCLTEASNVAQVQEAHQKAGVDLIDVLEVKTSD